MTFSSDEDNPFQVTVSLTVSHLLQKTVGEYNLHLNFHCHDDIDAQYSPVIFDLKWQLGWRWWYQRQAICHSKIAYIDVPSRGWAKYDTEVVFSWKY